jgi:hypothetical protein
MSKGAGTGNFTLNSSDPRSRIVERERTLESEKRKHAAIGAGGTNGANGNADAVIRKQLKGREDNGMMTWQLYMFVTGVLIVVLGGSLAIVFGAIWYFDQRNGTPIASGPAGEL